MKPKEIGHKLSPTEAPDWESLLDCDLYNYYRCNNCYCFFCTPKNDKSGHKIGQWFVFTDSTWYKVDRKHTCEYLTIREVII